MASRITRIKRRTHTAREKARSRKMNAGPTPNADTSAPQSTRPGQYMLTFGPANCECPICAAMGPPEYDENGWSIREVTPEMEDRLIAAYAQAEQMGALVDREGNAFIQAGREAAELDLSTEELDQHFMEAAERITGERWTGPTPSELMELGGVAEA